MGARKTVYVDEGEALSVSCPSFGIVVPQVERPKLFTVSENYQPLCPGKTTRLHRQAPMPKRALVP